MDALKKFGVIGAIVTILGGIAFAIMVDITTVQGYERGVLETWSNGVVDKVQKDKTHWLFPGFSQEMYTYPINTQTYVMNDTPSNIETIAAGREEDSYQIQSAEGQDMHISMNLMYHLDPEKIVTIHREVRDNWEERIIRPLLLRKVKDSATTYKAINAYSGSGLVKLQEDIQNALTPALAERGIIVENYAIEGIRLDSKYIGEIKLRQVAVQAELRAKQEDSTNLAKANAAKSAALADKFKVIVEAERDKEVGILNAEREARQVVVAAEASKEREVLAAQAEQEAAILRSQAILAIGEAEAEAKKLGLSAWAVPGADNFVRVQVAESLRGAFQNIKGYVPQGMGINVLAGSYTDAVDSIMVGVGNSATATVAAD